MIGSHSDIEFAVIKLAQQIANPLNKHYQAKLHFCRYLLNICKYWIVYNELNIKSVIAHSDSDWIQDPESHKSVTGYFILITYKVTF